MDLVAALAPPRSCRLGGEDIWVRPLGLEDYALLLGWLDDVLPGKDDRVIPPRLGDDASQEALDTVLGKVTIAYAALRHQGIGYSRCAEMVCRSTPEEWASFLAAAFARRRTAKDDGPGDRDIAEIWFGPSFATVCERYPGYMLETIGRLTLDQYALLTGQGLPEEDPRHLTWEQVEAMRLEGLRLQAERNGGGV